MKARRSDLIALAFLMAALVLFLLFQLLPNATYNASPFSGDMDWVTVRGYDYWVGMWRVIRDPDLLDAVVGAFYAAVASGAILVILAPFLVGPLSRSRVLWWIAVLSSGLVICGTTGLVIWWDFFGPESNESIQVGPGRNCFLAFPVVLLIGLLFIRRKTEEIDLRLD